jgi:acyl carrier protein
MPARDVEEIEDWLKARISELLSLSPDSIGLTSAFASFGLTSVHAAELSGDLERWLDRRLLPTLIWQYPSIRQLAEYLAKG